MGRGRKIDVIIIDEANEITDEALEKIIPVKTNGKGVIFIG